MIEQTNQSINEAVARKLGWTVSSNYICTDPTGSFRVGPKDYCTWIAAAWEILTEYCDTWDLFCGGSTVDCTLGKKYATASAEADTASMAICLAFLKLS